VGPFLVTAVWRPLPPSGIVKNSPWIELNRYFGCVAMLWAADCPKRYPQYASPALITLSRNAAILWWAHNRSTVLRNTLGLHCMRVLVFGT